MPGRVQQRGVGPRREPLDGDALADAAPWPPRATARPARRSPRRWATARRRAAPRANRRLPPRHAAQRLLHLARRRRQATRRAPCAAPPPARTGPGRSTTRCHPRSTTRAATRARAADACAGRVPRARAGPAPRAAVRHGGWRRFRRRTGCRARRGRRTVDLGPGEALVRGRDRQARRLGDDAGVGAHAALEQARVPALCHSSSTTAAITTSPASPGCAARHAAQHIAATPPFMSVAPRPYKRPSVVAPSNGGCVMPSTPTTSRCPLNISERPPGVPMRATTFGRPATTSCNDTRKPHASSTAGERARDFALGGRAGHQVRVARVDLHQQPGECDGVAGRWSSCAGRRRAGATGSARLTTWNPWRATRTGSGCACAAIARRTSLLPPLGGDRQHAAAARRA